MRCQSNGVALILSIIFSFDVVICHLKDLGEATINFTEFELDLKNRIVGGQPAKLEKFPFNAQFFNKGGLCSAIIVTRKSALTAAHCFDRNRNLGEMKIYAASRYLFDRTSQAHTIWDYVIHPRYNQSVMFSNDIAALLIYDAFVFNKYANVAVLSNSRKWMREDEKMFVASGWGETEFGGKPSTQGLLEANLRYISKKKCIRINRGITMTPEMFCLYGDGKRDTCRGDSGGGILWRNVVVGIVSHGNGCAKTPGIYVDVSYYQQWISDTLNQLITKYCHFLSVIVCPDIPMENGKFHIEGKIVGGDMVPLEEYPYAVQFFNYGAMCAGTVLSSWTVLTAAHCFDYNKDVEEMEIHAGVRHTYDHAAVRYLLWYYVVHEDYNKSLPFACDIAMIFVKRPIVLSNITSKAVVVNTDKWMVETDSLNFTATGWGWTEYGGQISKVGLMMTNLHYVSPQKCSALHNLRLSEDMFCLYGDGVRDTCKGDSGGGVEWRGMIVGVVSHGDGCAKKDKPSVYANVWYFKDWIHKQMNSFVKKYCQGPPVPDTDEDRRFKN